MKTGIGHGHEKEEKTENSMHKPHIDLAHAYWRQVISPGDTIIDATCGNGHDLCFLATLLNGTGTLIGYDIQKEALEKTKERLQTLSQAQREPIVLKHASHADFSEKEVKLIVYNLGYLPGGTHTITTQQETSLQSVKKGLTILSEQGAISITCYPGHPEGAVEEKLLVDFCSTLSPKRWMICYHRWINRAHAPSLIWIRSLLPLSS